MLGNPSGYLCVIFWERVACALNSLKNILMVPMDFLAFCGEHNCAVTSAFALAMLWRLLMNN